MNTFQFDKCLNDKKIIKRCQERGEAGALPLPASLWDVDDPTLLNHYMKLENPLLAVDRALPSEHAKSIPDENPGIVVIGFSRYIDKSKCTLKTMTSKAAERILSSFKSAFPDWPSLVLKNKIVEITDQYVEVSHVENGVLKRDEVMEFSGTPAWTTRLALILSNPQPPRLSLPTTSSPMLPPPH